MIIVTSLFSKSSAFKMFSVHAKAKSPRFKFPLSVLKELRFCDGLAWMVDLTVEIKLRFQILSA